MSVIYECDGCGKQSSDRRVIKPVEAYIKSESGQGGEEYHCCEQCERQLRQMANPTTWPRPAKERHPTP